MKKLLLFAFTFCLLPIAYCQFPYWQQQVNYKIDVTLNDADHTLDGFVKMDYHNNSPDTLYFIWIHLWPNAFKNDKTAFTDQDLENGSTDFYFSNADKRGYINRLDFKVNGELAKTTDHPQHQDIVKLILPKPIAPNSTAKIETPFHVKLPYNFSRGGHIDQAYQITQWYPKPAVYDRKGWHPMPYVDQGEFYAEFGNYEVQITLPDNYVVAATGDLQNESEMQWLKNRKPFTREPKAKKQPQQKKKVIEESITPASRKTKTLQYQQNNVTDFAWFADKTYTVKTDTLQLPSGKIITTNAFYYSENKENWNNSIAMIKRAILTKSKWLGEYPYNIVSVVDGGNGGGMEYPTITLLDDGGSEKMLDFVINHEVGHNWFQAILGTHERTHPWMDEGMNTYYDNRYSLQQYGTANLDIIQTRSKFINNRVPDDIQHLLLQTVIGVKKDQPIETTSEKFSAFNYNMVAYIKAGDWMKLLEEELGKETFDKAMQEYYKRWQFKHPYPEDFKKVVEEVSGKNLDATFSLLNKKGALKNPASKKDIRFASFFSLKETDKHHYIFASPAIGYNFYDKFMIGALVHNYTLPLTKFQFLVAPLYATKSKQLNGMGRASYTFYPGGNGQKFEVAVAGATFSGDNYTDSTNTTRAQRFSKIVPSLKYVFANKNPRSSITKFIQWKTFLIQEQGLLFTRDTVNQVDVITYPTESRYVNQLQFVIENNRVLYPYKGALQVEQGEGFARLAFTGNYFFNYAKRGGMDVRLFAGKFFYLGDKTFIKQFETDRYHLNMTGPKGNEDYTYSNYFVGRNEFEKFPSQQIMIRDGGFKVRTDYLSNKIGKTDDWLVALNFTSTIPKIINPFAVLPFKLPIKLFVDIGTYAEAWKKNAPTGRFVYDAGLQLSLFSNTVNIYIPLLYSKEYKDYFKSTITEKRFLKNIAFSIDLQNISLKKLVPQIPF
ncbi:MAG: M1 family metallopeptidase [Chitinophagaceae bacterium]|nr:M1 family metallopeptidase [Chitinophagaceae bacterium]